MVKRESAQVHLSGTVKRETEKGYLFVDENEIEHWLPKSQVDWDGAGTMVVPEWLSRKMGNG